MAVVTGDTWFVTTRHKSIFKIHNGSIIYK